MKQTILVVDDDLYSRKLLEVSLAAEGYAMRTAGNGEEALVSIADQAPDLILLDVMMPGMNGYELAALLKAEPLLAGIPVVMAAPAADLPPTTIRTRTRRLQSCRSALESFVLREHRAPSRVVQLGLECVPVLQRGSTLRGGPLIHRIKQPLHVGQLRPGFGA